MNIKPICSEDFLTSPTAVLCKSKRTCLDAVGEALSIEAIVFYIHQFLSHIDTTRTGKVCYLWRLVAHNNNIWLNANLERVFCKKLSFFDENVWKTHFDCSEFDLTFELPQDKLISKIKTIAVLKQFNISLKIEKDLGFTLLTLPKGLSLSKLQNLIQSPKKGSPCQFEIPIFLKGLKDFVVDKTYQIVITNNILSGSENSLPDYYANYYQQFDIEIPKLLEIATLCTLTYITSFPSIYLLCEGGPSTICSDETDEMNFVIGHFSKLVTDELGDVFKPTLEIMAILKKKNWNLPPNCGLFFRRKI
jgi:hypothetical protein